MTAFCVLTDDEILVAQIRAGLSRADHVLCLPSASYAPLPRSRLSECDTIAVDCRRLVFGDAVNQLLELRRRTAEDRRLVGIVGREVHTGVAVVTCSQAHDLDFILSCSDRVGVVLRAVGNDQSLTVCAAASLTVLSEVLQPIATEVAGIVLGSGCSIRSVSAAATEFGCSVSSLRQKLLLEGSGGSLGVIRFVQCVYALALARRTTINVVDIARFAGFAKIDRFHTHCAAALGGRTRSLAQQWPELGLDSFLRIVLSRAHNNSPRLVHVGLPSR